MRFLCAIPHKWHAQDELVQSLPLRRDDTSTTQHQRIPKLAVRIASSAVFYSPTMEAHGGHLALVGASDRVRVIRL
jgi:hypothetical protein